MRFIYFAVFILSLNASVLGVLVTRHTNIKCEMADKSYAAVKICRLKVLGRNKIGATVHISLLQLPVKAISVNFDVYRKLSGYHPFVFNVTVDFCHFITHRNRLNVFNYFYGAMEPFLNMNHSCPLNHDFIMKDFVLSPKMFSLFPGFPNSLMFKIGFITENVYRGTIYSYLDVNVDEALPPNKETN